MSIPFTPLVASLPETIPFVGPETLERSRGIPFSARIGANESAFGISPLAHKAIQDMNSIQGYSWYGDPENYQLRALLAEKHTIGQDSISVDAGIDTLLGLTVRLFVQPGDCVVTSDGAYPTFNYHVKASGGVLHTAPYQNNYEDPVALLDKARQCGARLIYLANPDNPMGTCLQASDIQQLIDCLPDQCLLMLDEAYIEFMADQSIVSLSMDLPNVLRYRTFSKAYGMAGMRIGYVMAHPDIIVGFNKIRNHFGVNKLAQVAAEASLRDSGFLTSVLNKVQEGRDRLYTLADNHSLEYIPSATNFVAFDMGDSQTAEALVASLANKGVFIRKPMVAPLNRYVRMGIGTDEEQEYLASALNLSL